MKLTASKMSRGAIARGNSVFSRDGRFDFSALFGCIMVGVGRVGGDRVGFGGVGLGRVGDAMVGVGVGTAKGACSCKTGKGESEDDFELHFGFLCCGTGH